MTRNPGTLRWEWPRIRPSQGPPASQTAQNWEPANLLSPGLAMIQDHPRLIRIDPSFDFYRALLSDARSSKNLSMAYFLLLLNHIGVCKFNFLIQYLEIVIELSSSNKIYRNLAEGLVWRPERNGKEFDYLFAFCNCSSSAAIIVSPLVSFECSMTIKSSCDVDLIANG
jgi:hypothetical protein